MIYSSTTLPGLADGLGTAKSWEPEDLPWTWTWVFQEGIDSPLTQTGKCSRDEPIPGIGLAGTQIFLPFLAVQVQAKSFICGLGSLESASPRENLRENHTT